MVGTVFGTYYLYIWVLGPSGQFCGRALRFQDHGTGAATAVGTARKSVTVHLGGGEPKLGSWKPKTHTHTYTYIYIYICTYVYTYACPFVCIYMRTMHTYICEYAIARRT